jgi:hypothetical protein
VVTKPRDVGTKFCFARDFVYILSTGSLFDNTEEELRARIEESFTAVTPPMILDSTSKLNLLRRARLCLQMNGALFEHLL